MSAPNSLLLRACKALPVDRTPVWLMRQAGRYMAEYRAVRKDHSLIEICKKPSLAAEVTITAAEILKVDAAIIFADLLLPLEVMGLPFRFSAGEGPVVEQPVRTREDVARLRTDSAADLGYVAEAVGLVAAHFGAELPLIGFCGAPFTLASYMIEGGGSRHYVKTKTMMHTEPALFDDLLAKIVTVTAEYAAEQVRAGADVIQVFDSWVGLETGGSWRARCFGSGGGQARAHFQPRPRNLAGDSGGKCEGAGFVCAGVLGQIFAEQSLWKRKVIILGMRYCCWRMAALTPPSRCLNSFCG